MVYISIQCIQECIINPRRACVARVTVLNFGLSFCPSVRLSVCLSVCYHVFCHYVQQGSQTALPTGSVSHWLDFNIPNQPSL